MSVLGELLKELALSAGRGAVEALRRLLRKKPEPESEPVHPKFRDIEHRRAQERSAIAFKVPPAVMKSKDEGEKR